MFGTAESVIIYRDSSGLLQAQQVEGPALNFGTRSDRDVVVEFIRDMPKAEVVAYIFFDGTGWNASVYTPTVTVVPPKPVLPEIQVDWDAVGRKECVL